jgi:hypothetical protein
MQDPPQPAPPQLASPHRRQRRRVKRAAHPTTDREASAATTRPGRTVECGGSATAFDTALTPPPIKREAPPQPTTLRNSRGRRFFPRRPYRCRCRCRSFSLRLLVLRCHPEPLQRVRDLLQTPLPLILSSAFSTSVRIDPLLLAVPRRTQPPLAVILRSAVCDEGSHSCPGHTRVKRPWICVRLSSGQGFSRAKSRSTASGFSR